MQRSKLTMSNCSDEDYNGSLRLGRRLLVWTVVGLIRVYKIAVSPLFPGACRYYPSCSSYMAEAVELHGPLKGVWMGLRRLGRCHPFGRHGYDPVPRS